MGHLKEIEDIVGEICDKYCKFPEMYNGMYDDEDKATEKLFEERCANCPITKL